MFRIGGCIFSDGLDHLKDCNGCTTSSARDDCLDVVYSVLTNSVVVLIGRAKLYMPPSLQPPPPALSEASKMLSTSSPAQHACLCMSECRMRLVLPQIMAIHSFSHDHEGGRADWLLHAETFGYKETHLHGNFYKWKPSGISILWLLNTWWRRDNEAIQRREKVSVWVCAIRQYQSG